VLFNVEIQFLIKFFKYRFSLMNKNPMFNYMIIMEFLHAFQAINEWLLTIFSLS